ncbi:MAG TPA: hypothetical protein VFY18_09790 [Candidatus Limnocylindrales bacterium]|nr:hypothetical protein [Candidatus Limnocylindrales bacterium]
MRIRRDLVAIDVAVKVATVALLAWAVLSPDLPQFQGKAFTGRAVAYPAALLAAPILWWLLARRRIPFPVAADILLGLPFLIDVAGNALNLYDTIEWWDDLNHLVNWALHTAAIGLLLRHGTWTPSTRVALAFCWAVTTAALWEFAEYVTFVPNSPEATTAYADTLLDLALGMTGGLIAAILVARLPPQARTTPADSATVGR